MLKNKCQNVASFEQNRNLWSTTLLIKHCITLRMRGNNFRLPKLTYNRTRNKFVDRSLSQFVELIMLCISYCIQSDWLWSINDFLTYLLTYFRHINYIILDGTQLLCITRINRKGAFTYMQIFNTIVVLLNKYYCHPNDRVHYFIPNPNHNPNPIISYPIIWIPKVLKFKTLHYGCVRNSGFYGEVLGLVPIFSDVHYNSNALFHSWWNSNSLYCDSIYASISILGGTQILCTVGTHGIASCICVHIFNTVIALLHKCSINPQTRVHYLIPNHNANRNPSVHNILPNNRNTIFF